MRSLALVLGLVFAFPTTQARVFDPVGVVIVDGNSMTRETTDSNAFADWMGAAWGNPPKLSIAKTGKPGWTTWQLRGFAPMAVDPLMEAGKVNVVLLLEVANSLTMGRGVEDTVNDLAGYVDDRRLWARWIGASVVVGMLTAPPFYSTNPDLDWQRQAVNTRIRQGDTTADFVIDVAGADPFIGVELAIHGPMYRADRVHFSQAGSRYVGELVARSPVLLAALRGDYR